MIRRGWFIFGISTLTNGMKLKLDQWYHLTKKTADAPITLITCLTCNLLTWNCFQKKLRNQFDDVTDQFLLFRDIPRVNFNFIPCREVQKMKKLIFSMWNLTSKLWMILRICSLHIGRYFTFQIWVCKNGSDKIWSTLAKFY